MVQTVTITTNNSHHFVSYQSNDHCKQFSVCSILIRNCVCVFSLQNHPPKKDRVRAVSIQTGYLVQSQGPTNHCTLTYLAQVDPRGKQQTHKRTQRQSTAKTHKDKLIEAHTRLKHAHTHTYRCLTHAQSSNE